MAGAEDPATLSGLCQAMAIAMVGGSCSDQRRMRLSSKVRVKLSSMMMTRFWSAGRRHPYWSTSFLAQGPAVLSTMPWGCGRESRRNVQSQSHVDENVRRSKEVEQKNRRRGRRKGSGCWRAGRDWNLGSRRTRVGWVVVVVVGSVREVGTENNDWEWCVVSSLVVWGKGVCEFGGLKSNSCSSSSTTTTQQN